MDTNNATCEATAAEEIFPTNDKPKISDTAIIHGSMVIGDGVTIFGYANIGKNVNLGNHCTIGRFASIGDGAVLGEGCIVEPFARVPAKANITAGTIVKGDAQ